MNKPGLAKAGTRSINRAAIIDGNFLAFLGDWDLAVERADPGRPLQQGAGLTGAELLDLFDAMLASRHLDFVAREMRARNEGFYTIGSCGHEANAVVGGLTRATDPAFLHYRSGAFMMARTAKLPDCDPVYDTALSLAASREDPISGGRHKVWGSREAWVLPQTSTIASHLPKAVGTAIAIAQANRLHEQLPVPDDSIVVCSFGDGSVNHSVAQGAFNAAQWTSFQHLPAPVLFVCEDNGIGISVRTPDDWVRTAFMHRRGIQYFHADGHDVVAAHAVASEAVDTCRRTRRPVFLHLSVNRLLGHAGTDVESNYRAMAEIEAAEAADPLLLAAESILEAGLATPGELRDRYEAMRERARKAAARAATRPKLTSAADVISPLAPNRVKAVAAEAARTDYDRSIAFGDGPPPEHSPPRHMAIQINRALHDLMAKYPPMTLFGEDVAQKGGVYTVTTGLHRVFGGMRVWNTLLDETTILGLAQGAAYMGMLPFPEIQYLAYFHNACDQIRGEACSLQYFSGGKFRNGMVMRIASLAYQKGFGGHFHNDNSIAALRDIPGLVLACPSRGDDAAMMLRSCAALAHVDGTVVGFLEPIALYMNKDLYEAKDNRWCFDYPEPQRLVPLGEGRVYEPSATDLLVVTYGNGVPIALRAARTLAQTIEARTRLLDLRWLKPLNHRFIAQHADEVGRVLVVDEGRRTGGISEEIFTCIDEHCSPEVVKRRVTGEDSYIPLAEAANLVLASEDGILETARSLLS